MSINNRFSQLFQSLKKLSKEHPIEVIGIVLALPTTIVAWASLPKDIREKVFPERSKTEFTAYENIDYGISVQYPKDWQVRNIYNPITGEIVEFISPKENNSDKFQEKVTVTVETKASFTLIEYTNLVKQDILKNIKNAQIISESEDILAGNRSYRVVYTGLNKNIRIKNMDVWNLNNFQAYYVSYNAKEDKYDKYLPIVNDIIKSLQIKAKKSK
ncbi:PsbP-related protein [Scytonema sp. NUACC26]|uniref:PsbP-related protein n=1 Tax=Scytonema sp. NUACC26 TaxID=3140176 RepID=UPI0034DC8033